MAMHKKYDGCLLLLGRKEGEKPHEDAGESYASEKARERGKWNVSRLATIDTLRSLSLFEIAYYCNE
eukprot:scaffold624_cov158-Skeletonema_menzelii.AAC.3